METHLPLSKNSGTTMKIPLFCKSGHEAPIRGVSAFAKAGHFQTGLKGTFFFQWYKKSGNKPTTTRLLGHIPGKWGDGATAL